MLQPARELIWTAAARLEAVIAGVTRPEQVHANVQAAAWEPGAEELARIDALTAAQRYRA
ncbi:MAG: hypothetical protein IT484_04465 [Gammaproteobacteria bacterium]|nr:hypothetical protein [Gammaproteobacteria bacterium]